MADLKVPSAKGVIFWVLGLASVAALGFVVGWSLKKGQKAAS